MFSRLFRRVGLLGVKINTGQSKLGVAETPNLMGRDIMVQELQNYGVSVTDFGDIHGASLQNDTPIHQAINPRHFQDNTWRLSKKIEEILHKHRDMMMINVGGDHSLSVGSITGIAQVHSDLCVLWVDAHADINIPLKTPSGNMHGMPVAFLVQEMKEMVDISGFNVPSPVLPARNIAYIGLRDVDDFEKEIIAKFGITAYTSDDVHRRGIDTILGEALSKINPGMTRPIHLSFDIDALDPVYAPSTGTPVSNGLTLDEGMYICNELCHTGMLSSMDLTEINLHCSSPSDAKLTLQSAQGLIMAAVGLKESFAKSNKN